MSNVINQQEENHRMDPAAANFMFSQMASKMNMMPSLGQKMGPNPSIGLGTGNSQMQNIDLFMSNVIQNISGNNMPNIPPANIQAIQKMLESQGEPGNPGLHSQFPLNANTNNPDLNNINNIANNFGNIVEAINTYNSRHINYNNNVVSTVNNLTGVLSKTYGEQEKQNLGGDGNGEMEDKKDESKFICFKINI
jgi:hypothetical protein